MATSAVITGTYTTAGTYTWVGPAGVTSVNSEAWGGGGHGDLDGGGGGEYAAEAANTVTQGNSYTVVAGATGATDGAAGSSSTFSGTGATTVTAHGGGGGNGSTGGSGGTGSANTTHHNGGAGGATDGVTQLGGGGGSGGTSSAGNAGAEVGTSGTGGAAAVTGGGPGGNAGSNGGSAGFSPVSGPGGGGGGGFNGGSTIGAAGWAGQVRLTYSQNAPVVFSSSTTGSTWTWTAPTGITSVSYTISGTASFDSHSSSGNETVIPGTAYTFSVGAGGSLTISWGVTTDQNQVLPGPTWLRSFKPGLAHQRPPVPQAVGDPANAPNLRDVQTIQPGTVWLDHYKPGLPKLRPFIPVSSGITCMGSAALQPYASAGTGSVTPGFTGGANLAPYRTSGTVGVPVVASGGAQPGAYSARGSVGVPVVASGSAALQPYGVSTPSYLRDLPHIQPGIVWLDHYKPGTARSLKIPGGPGMAGARGSASLSPYGTSGRSVVYLPFPQFNLSLMYEMLVNGTWTDITQFVYWRDDQVITRGLPDETQSATPSQMTLTLDNRDGRFSVLNTSGAYYPYLTRNVQVRCSIVNQASATGVPYSGYRFWGELSSDPPAWDPTGSDVYCHVTVSGPLRRYVQGAKMGSALRQYYSTLTGSFAPYAVWPCEDGSSATQIASLLPSVAAMSITGKPQFASDSSFGGSDPVPVVSSSVWHGVTGASADPPGTGSITQKFPGTYSFTAPPGVTAVTGVTATGAGGGGGDTDGTTGGGGGGGGGSQNSASVAVTAGRAYTYVVGSGGAAGAGAAGGSGTASSFTGDSATVTGGGGAGGSYAGAGGAGGSGAHHGGAGGSGEASSSYNGYSSVSGTSGATGGGTNIHEGVTSTPWTAPSGVTSASVASIAAGGGGGAGGGGNGGGQGGGGGACATGTIDTTPGSTYTFYAGNGGRGSTGGSPGPSNGHGNSGGDSGATGDSASVIAGGGDGGRDGGGDGIPGTVTSGSGFSGGGGGGGTNQTHGGGGSGGGGASTGGTGASGAGADGDSGGHNLAGGDGGSFTGSSASAGLGGSEYGVYGSGGGGGASNNSLAGAYGSSGGGGAGGITQWTWTQTGSPTGGGGGSSAGASVNGNSGSSSGTGGSAPSGGGSGGNAGATPAGNGPGGGGAGAVPAFGSASAASPGNGAAGQVSFSWSGGVTSPVAADIVRFLLHVNSAGAADGAVLVRIITYGTVAQCDVVYHAGGTLTLVGYNSSSSVIFTSAAGAFSANGTPLYVDVELTGSGSNVNYTLSAIQRGAASPVATVTGSVAGTVGYVSDIYTDPAGAVTDTATSVGWITAQTYADTLVNMSQIVNGYAGELAANRISRLCAAQGLGFELTGNASDTPQMGPQQDDTFNKVLQSCADLDRGQLYEARDQFGIGYRTRRSMQGQSPALIASYAAGTLASALKPTADDQFTRNDITVTRNGGASSSAALATGAMSVQTPPNGVGDYTYSLTVQAYSDTQLANLVAWMLTTGTVSEYRFPQIPFDLARSAVADLLAEIAGLDIGDFVQIPDPPVFLQNYPVNQLCWGFTEVLNSRKWTIAVNAVPEDPYAGSGQPTW